MNNQLPIIDARRVRRITGRLPFAQREGMRSGVTTRPVVALHETGRDCDGWAMDSISYAHPEAVEAYIDYKLEWAEGPMQFTALTERELAQWHESRPYGY